MNTYSLCVATQSFSHLVRGEEREGGRGRKGGRLVEKTYTFVECSVTVQCDKIILL